MALYYLSYLLNGMSFLSLHSLATMSLSLTRLDCFCVGYLITKVTVLVDLTYVLTAKVRRGVTSTAVCATVVVIATVVLDHHGVVLKHGVVFGSSLQRRGAVTVTTG